jgi:membrane protein DedA with SNARE-associated domain
MMDLEYLVVTYGYAIIFLMTLLEGETIVIVAGAIAYLGLLDPRWVAIVAFVGSFTSDQVVFHLARHHTDHRFVRWAKERPTFSRALALVERNATVFILSFRFVYGIRNISAVALGLSNVAANKYLVLNAIAAAIWAASFTATGYYFGHAAEAFLGKVAGVEKKILAALAIGVVFYLLYRLIAPWIRRLRANENS